MQDFSPIQEKVREFIIQTSYVSDDEISNDTLIFAQGIMDSMGFISIIGYIEEQFSITPNDDELLEENFESIHAITDFVARKIKEKENQPTI